MATGSEKIGKIGKDWVHEEHHVAVIEGRKYLDVLILFLLSVS